MQRLTFSAPQAIYKVTNMEGSETSNTLLESYKRLESRLQ